MEIVEYLVMTPYFGAAICWGYAVWLFISLKKHLYPHIVKPSGLLNAYWYMAMPNSAYTETGIEQRKKAVGLLWLFVKLAVLGLLLSTTFAVLGQHS